MAKRIKDMKKGNMYEWMYMGNKCVGHVTFTGPRVVRCHYAVGMWEDSDAIEDAVPDYLAIDINVADYDIDDIRDATIDQKTRYTRVVKEYQDMITRMNDEYKKEQRHSNWLEAPVSCDSSQDNYNTIGEALGESELVRPELINPADRLTRIQNGVTVVDKIDLDSIDTKTRPTKKTKEEKRLEREEKARREHKEAVERKKQKMEADMKEQELQEKELNDMLNEDRLHRLGEQMKIERNLSGQPEAYYPNGASGHKYKDEEIIRFRTNGHEGMAVGMINQYTGERGYYVATNILGDNTVALHGATLGDGTVAGHWPLSTTAVTQPSKLEIQMGQFMVQTYRSHIDAVKEQNRIDFEAEQERIRKEEEERQAREAAEQLAKEEAERKAKLDAEVADEEQEATMFAGITLPHLPYCRGTESLLDLKWPNFSDELTEYQVFFGLAEFSKIISVCKCNQRQDETGFRTVMLTRPYLRELRSRRDEYMQRGTTFRHVLGVDMFRCGAVCYRSGINLDDLTTIIYNIEIHKNGRETLRLALLVNCELQCTYRGSTQGAFGDASPVVAYMTDNNPKNLRQMAETAKKFIFAFLCMEQDTDQTIRKYVSGEGAVHKVYERSHLASQPDIELRDSTWFTNIFVNKTISVDSYKSHRWFGHGEDKELREVEVSAYTKGGYTMKAKVTK